MPRTCRYFYNELTGEKSWYRPKPTSKSAGGGGGKDDGEDDEGFDPEEGLLPLDPMDMEGWRKRLNGEKEDEGH